MPILTEISKPMTGDPYTTIWECEPPEWDEWFICYQDEWSDDFTIRTILHVTLLPLYQPAE